MKKIFSILIVLYIGCFTSFAQIPRGKSCEALGRPDIVVQPFEVLGNLLPNLNQFSLTEACMTNARNQNKLWAQEDLNNWERLSNQLCSAKAGWVEHNPGTCQAGGPPPICKVDHWYRDAGKAMASFNNLRGSIAQQRFDSLMSSSCDCLRTELENKVTENMPKQDTSNPFNINTNPFVIPCTGGSNPCPPGTSCKDGTCKAPAYVQKVDKVTDFATGKAKDQVIDQWLGLFKELADIRIPAALASVYGKIVTPALALLETPTLGQYRSIYSDSMWETNRRLSRLRGLYQELQNYYRNKPARAPSAISADIKKEKEALRKSMADLNIYYLGIVKERELSRYTCYNVFEFQNQMVNQSIVNVLSLPEPEK